MRNLFTYAREFYYEACA